MVAYNVTFLFLLSNSFVTAIGCCSLLLFVINLWSSAAGDYGSRLSHILHKTSVWVFPIWYTHQCVKCVQTRSFFWSVYPCIRTEYGEIRSISPYSVRMRENMDQKKLCIWTLITQCSISLDILGTSIPMSLSLSEKPGITITNVLYLVFRTKNLV